MSAPTVEEAVAAFHEKDALFRAAQKELDVADAVLARVLILKAADKHSSIVSLDFEREYNSDDEGGTFASANVAVTFSADDDGGYDEDEITDEIRDELAQFYADTIAFLFAGDRDANEGTLTIADVREWADSYGKETA